jgi:hypothetical protein
METNDGKYMEYSTPKNVILKSSKGF